MPVSSPAFCPELSGYVGAEIEAFTIDSNCRVAALAPRLFDGLIGYPGYKPEFPACQAEVVSPPRPNPSALAAVLDTQLDILEAKAAQYSVGLAYVPVAPTKPPLVHTRTERYDRIADTIDKDMMRAGFSVAGVHIHYGCRNMTHMLAVFARLAAQSEYFWNVGTVAGSARRSVYEGMPGTIQVLVSYDDWDHVLAVATKHGWDSLADCWWPVRISRYGTVEVRCFDSTDDTDLVAGWAREVIRVAEGG